jgi:hypothetical protein
MMSGRSTGRLYGASWEAKFFRRASTHPDEAKQDFDSWSKEIEARIAAIRAGGCCLLTFNQASARAQSDRSATPAII